MREATNESLRFLEEMRDEIERKLGAMRVSQGSTTITLPLDSVDISARAVGRVVEVTLTQVFKNPYSEHLEAEYIFPLAGCSSVNGFKMHVGDRTVVGTMQERGAAREEYNRALSEGKRASLLEQERDDIFTMQVGNIPPQESITVELTYTEKLEFFEDGTTELRLPLVVAPRYVPGTPLSREQVGDGVMSDTDLVPDASRISPPRLAGGSIPDVSLRLNVELTPELASNRDGRSLRISDLACSQHAVQTRTDDGIIRVTLARADELLNRDFILSWRQVSEQMTSSVVLYRKAGKESKQEGYAMLSLIPPASAGVASAPRDVIFVLDRSGSMAGSKMVSAARSCAILMSTLGPKDRFAINAFDNECQWYMDSPTQHLVSVGKFFEANLAAVEKGVDFLKAVTARGGTELGRALVQSLDLIQSSKKKGRVPVIVVLTDGQIGNESQLFNLVQKGISDTRIFTVGIDTGINYPFLNRLAALGSGTATFVTPGGELENALIQVGREIGAPLVTDLEIESLTGGVTIDALAPARLPDLFTGRASDCLFRLNCKIPLGAVPKFRIRGKLANGRKYTEDISAQLVNAESISRLWARGFIKELEDDYRVNPAGQHDTKQKIIDLSLKFSVLTKFTAFVAVDQAETVNMTGEVRHIVQPVHVPDQWQLDSLFAGMIGGSSLAPGSAGGGINTAFLKSRGASVDQSAASGWAVPASPSPASQPTPPPSHAFDSPAPQAQWQSQAANMETGSFASYPREQKSDEGWIPMGPTPNRGRFSQLSQPPSGTTDQISRNSSWASWSEPIQPRSSADNSPKKESNSFGHVPLPEPAPPALPTPHPVSPPRSAWSTMKKLFSAGNSNSKPLESPQGAPVARILNALKNFREAWMASWTEIGKGGVPDADLIENARKALIEALADHPVGFEVPRLQKFLRTSAIEYVAALQASDVSASKLFQARAQFNHGLVDAMVEGEDAMVKVQGRQGAFWESIV